jgi:hypothetical protein
MRHNSVSRRANNSMCMADTTPTSSGQAKRVPPVCLWTGSTKGGMRRRRGGIGSAAEAWRKPRISEREDARERWFLAFNLLGLCARVVDLPRGRLCESTDNASSTWSERRSNRSFDSSHQETMRLAQDRLRSLRTALHSSRQVFFISSDINFTSDKTGMKFVSPDHRGTMWKCICLSIPAPATRPRFAPRLNP